MYETFTHCVLASDVFSVVKKKWMMIIRICLLFLEIKMLSLKVILSNQFLHIVHTIMDSTGDKSLLSVLQLLLDCSAAVVEIQCSGDLFHSATSVTRV